MKTLILLNNNNNNYKYSNHSQICDKIIYNSVEPILPEPSIN